MTGEPLLIARELRKVFGLSQGGSLVAVDDVSLSVNPGEIVGLLGPNGAGKTTTLRMLVGLSRPTRGSAKIAGYDVQKAPLKARASLGYLSATSGLPPRLTVREVLETIAAVQGVKDPKKAVMAAVETFNLNAFADRLVNQLSTGMLQRTRVACATIHSPKVLVLDEPTAGLDIVAAAELMGFVMAARRRGAAVLFSTHILSEVETACDRVAILNNGRIYALGTPQELISQTDSADLKGAFLSLVASTTGDI